MTLPSTGSLSISQVNTELGRSSGATTSLGETTVRSLAAVASGAIGMSNLQGKSAGAAPTTYSPVAGTYSVDGMGSASFSITASAATTWTYTKTGAGATSVTVASGSSSTSISFSLTNSSASDKIVTFTITATSGGVSQTFTVTLTAYTNL